MTEYIEQHTIQNSVTTSSTMREKSFHSPRGQVTSQIVEQQSAARQPERQTITSSNYPTTDRSIGTDKERNRSTLSPTFSEFLNDRPVDPATNYPMVGISPAVEPNDQSGQTTIVSQANEVSAHHAPEAIFRDVVDMSPFEFDQLLASAANLFPEDLNNTIQLDAHGEQIHVPQQILTQGTSESSIIEPDLSPDTLNRIFGPMPTALDELNLLAENAVKVPDFPNLLHAEPEPFYTGSPGLPYYVSPVEQYPYPAPDHVYPPLSEDTIGLPNQSGQYSYPPPLQNSTVQFKQVLNLPAQQPLYGASMQDRTLLPRSRGSYAEAAHGSFRHPLGSSYSQSGQSRRAISLQDSYPQIPSTQGYSPQAPSSGREVSHAVSTQRHMLEPRPRRINDVPSEPVENFIDYIQPAPADRNAKPFQPKSQGQDSLGSEISTQSSSDHFTMVRAKTSKPQLPKALASNFYRLYAKDKREDAKERGVKADQKISARTEKILGFDPEEHYAPLERPPKPWDVFRYTDQGELEADTYYTAEEIRRYLFNNPQHKKKGLILWIQRKPADCGRRYPNFASQRCRFQDCPARGNLVASGQYRVALDQQSPKGRNYDPHYNAGYVHLYCLERFLDFPELCKRITVRAEDRKFPEEPKQHNNMALSLKEEIQFANFFIMNCRKGRVPSNYPRYNAPNRPHEGTLSHTLSCVKLRFEPMTAKKRRAVRGTKTALEWHMGDLVRETELSTRPMTAMKRRMARRARRTRKVREDDDASEGETGMSDGDLEAEHGRPQKRQKTRQAEEAAGMELGSPLAGPLTRAKKRSIDEEADELIPKRR